MSINQDSIKNTNSTIISFLEGLLPVSSKYNSLIEWGLYVTHYGLSNTPKCVKVTIKMISPAQATLERAEGEIRPRKK